VPRERLLSHAKSFSGCAAELSCYVALAVSAGETRLFEHMSVGRVCAPEDLPERAGSLEDLFVLDAVDISAICPLAAALHPTGRLSAEGVDLRAGSKAAARSSTAADCGEGMTSALLARPYRWRAYLGLAYDLMYADMEKTLRAAARSGNINRAGPIAAVTGIAADAANSVVADVKSSVSSVSAALRGLVARSGDAGSEAGATVAVEQQRRVMEYDAAHPLCGRFENHITVTFPDGDAGDAECERFMRVAKALDIKVVSIALPRGARHPTQVMTSYYTVGHVRRCTEALAEQALLLTLCGFRCGRVKMELQLTEDVKAPFFQRGVGAALPESATAPPSELQPLPVVGICPYGDGLANDRRAMTALQYFEFHVKVVIPESRVADATPALKDVAGRHVAHLSKNAFKVYVSATAAGTPQDGDDAAAAADARSLQYFLTLRKYKTGFRTCLDQLHALQADADETLRRFGGRVTTVQREYSVFDSNTGLDAGWFERGQPTPSFMAAD